MYVYMYDLEIPESRITLVGPLRLFWDLFWDSILPSGFWFIGYTLRESTVRNRLRVRDILEWEQGCYPVQEDLSFSLRIISFYT
jgi:hypothetical protein